MMRSKVGFAAFAAALGFCASASADPIDLDQLLLDFRSGVGDGPAHFFTEAEANTAVHTTVHTGQSRLSFSLAASPVHQLFKDETAGVIIDGTVPVNPTHRLVVVSSGTAVSSADMFTGKLHAKAGASTLVFPYGPNFGFPADATAWFGDTLFFTHPGASSTTLTTVEFSMHLDGVLDNGALTGYTTSGLAHAVVNVWAGNTPEYCLAGGFCSDTSPNVQAGRIFETLGGTPMELVEIDSTYKTSFSFLGAGAIVPIVAMLSVGGQFGMADLGDTATFSFNLPDDVSYISSSGHFLEGTPTPETSTWAMMLIGLAGIGYAGYRRAREPAA
jgi:hypothetical protein